LRIYAKKQCRFVVSITFCVCRISTHRSFYFYFIVRRFPIHCAVLGGNVDLVKWLVDVHMCPLSLCQSSNGQMKSLQTSELRTLLDLAMTGRRPKVDVLMFLVQKGLSIEDVKDTSLASKTLQVILQTGRISFPTLGNFPSLQLDTDSRLPIGNERNDHYDSNHQITTIAMDHNNYMSTEDICRYPTVDDSVTVVEDMCTICCETTMDCALVPCGHQICCSTCGNRLVKCPMCKVSCTVLRLYR
jgi:Zinc finger, C3HC4 type (RING finger)